MPTILKYALYLAAVIIGLNIGYTLGHWRGKADGEKLAIADQNVIATKEAVKATSQREKIDHETRKLSDSAIDAELRAGGWMRSDEDR
ncbi:hypothetical protein [Dyadobacter bucti]|uniref:hypothetical protein n=1 Tax=Dyadobacter bucti TaxID=2572203 RepID=UPI0011088129|nr:hypothetical protein [Dyadobacter bucti]